MTSLTTENYTLPGAQLGKENPLPYFRDPQVSLPVKTIAPFPPEKTAYLGWEIAFRVLPYRMQDQYTRQRQPVTYRAAVLENEFLRATFLPEVGGRLVSLVHKPEGRELLHRNPVFQPANLAIRNAWFSGGIEWNIGQFGHTFNTCAPVFAARIKGPQGEPALRLYEFERCKGLFWQIDFILPPGLPFLVAYTRVINPKPDPVAMYWWTNIAVNESADVRVLAPAKTALYGLFEKDGIAFGSTGLPALPSLDGRDGTYSLNSTFANEFFFQCDGEEMPWEAALDGRGTGLVESSTARLKYRKLFCWGTHAGGRQWQEYLSQRGEAYVEIQAGLAPTQVHGLPMPGQSAWDWTQVFGYLEADPAWVHGQDWPAAVSAVDAALKAKLSQPALYGLEDACRQRADTPPEEILQNGSGWGALELYRRTHCPDATLLPASCVFPPQTLGAEQQKWIALLEKGALAANDSTADPGEWMTQPDWQALLEQSVQTESGQNWFAWLHLGVMRMEQLDYPGAKAAWQESLRLQPSAWAYRNLAVLHLRQENEAEALDCYEKAWALASEQASPPPALAAEYLQMLVGSGQFEKGLQIFLSMPALVQETDRVQILRGQIAMALGDLQAVEQVLNRPYAVIREGETVLSDLWFELQARREAVRTGRALDEVLRQEVRQRFSPPGRIDFRSFNE